MAVEEPSIVVALSAAAKISDRVVDFQQSALTQFLPVKSKLLIKI